MLEIQRNASYTSIHTQQFTDEIKNLKLITTIFFNITKFFKYNNLKSENNQTKEVAK